MPLISHYPLHGNAVDVRGNNDGTINGAIETSGILGTPALSFDGTDNYVGSVYDIDSAPFTLSVWFKSDTNGLDGPIYSNHGNPNSNSAGITIKGDSGNITSYLGNGSAYTQITGNSITANTWYHASVTHNGSTARLYLNAIENTSASTGFGGQDQLVPRIGSSEYYSSYFSGDIADVRIYDHALSPSEVQYLYNVVDGPSEWTSTKKTISISGSGITLRFNDVTIPTNTSATAFIYEDSDDDGNAEVIQSVPLSAGQVEYTVSGFNGGSNNSYWVRIEEQTTDVTTTASITESLEAIGYVSLSRTTTVSGSGATDVSRTTSRTRLAAISGDARASSLRDLSKWRTASGDAAGEINATRSLSAKLRSSTIEGDGEAEAAAELTEVFQSESSADLDFDLITDPVLGFASEWVYEDSQLPSAEVDAFTAVLDIRFDNPFQIRIQYKSEQGSEEVYTTEPRTIRRENQVNSFEELGEDGYYRIIISNMRPKDHLRAITWGPTRF